MKITSLISEFHYRSAFASHENAKALAEAGFLLADAVIFADWRRVFQQDKIIVKRFIKNFVSNMGDPYLGYLEFCERIMLDDELRVEGKGGRMPDSIPEYFEPGNRFDKTKAAHVELMKKRTMWPNWKKEWKGLAEAILEIQELPSPYLIRYWEEWLSEYGTKDELILLRIAIGKSVHCV